MGKMIVIGSGLLALATWLAGRFLMENIQSPLADFTLFICLPFFAVIFLLSLFLVRKDRFSRHEDHRFIWRRRFPDRRFLAAKLWYATDDKKSGYPLLGASDRFAYRLYTCSRERSEAAFSHHLPGGRTWRRYRGGEYSKSRAVADGRTDWLTSETTRQAGTKKTLRPSFPGSERRR